MLPVRTRDEDIRQRAERRHGPNEGGVFAGQRGFDLARGGDDGHGTSAEWAANLRAAQAHKGAAIKCRLSMTHRQSEWLAVIECPPSGLL